MHPFEEAELHGGDSDGGPGVTGGDESLGVAFFDQFGGDGDGGIFFPPERFGSGLLHADDFGSLDESGTRVGEATILCGLFQLFNRTGEDDGLNFGVFCEDIARSFEIDERGVISAHGVECNLHHGKKARRVPPRSLSFGK